MLGIQGPRHYRKVGEMNGNKARDFQPDTTVYSKAEMRMLLDEKADLIIKAHGFKDQRDELREELKHEKCYSSSLENMVRQYAGRLADEEAALRRLAREILEQNGEQE